MKRTKIEIYPAPSWTEDDVKKAKRLHDRTGTCDMTTNDDPAGWRLTIERDYPDKSAAIDPKAGGNAGKPA